MPNTDDLLRRLNAHLPIAGDRLAGKVAIVSGGGSGGEFLGVGAACSILFAAQGAAVGVLDTDKERGQRTCDYIAQLGGRAKLLLADITTRADCKRAVAEAVAQFGGLNIVMNNAAIARRGTFETVSEEDWHATFNVNTIGTLNLAQATAPHLAAKGGAILNVSTVAALRAYGLSIAYSASKAAVEAMTRDMAHTMGSKGVRVNCIIPGNLHTPIGGGKTPETREARRLGTLLGVEGSAWDLAWGSLFLVSDEARWITGTTLVVDAGATILQGLSPNAQAALAKNAPVKLANH